MTSLALPSPLVGRDRELGILRQHLAAARAGQGSLALISGVAGIGKTALTETLCRDATDTGALVLIGRCFDLTETPAYGPWLYLFERYSAMRARTATATAALPSAFSQPVRIGEVADQGTLFRQVLDFIKTTTAHQPLVLLLDDVHWADPASLDLLRFLAQSVRTMPLIVLVTYRSDEVTRQHRLHTLLPLLVREATAERLDLHRLDAAATRAFVLTRYDLAGTDIDRLVAYLEARAEGNALFLGELLRSLEESDTLRRDGGRWLLGDLTQVTVPLLLQQVIDGRLGRLDAESQRLLAVAAVIGQEVSLDVWATVAAVDEEAVIALVERGEEAHLLAAMPDGAHAQFTHGLVRQAVYERVQPIRRRRLHRAIAEALIAEPDTEPDAVAHHLQQAGDARATEWLIRAGERAEQAYAWLTAATRYEAALATPGGRHAQAGERGWLLYRCAVLRRFADTAQGIVYLDEAARLAEQIGDAVLAAYIGYYRGHLRCLAGQYRQGIPLLEAGVAALESLPDAEHGRLTRFDIVDRRRSRGTLASWLVDVGRFAEVRALREQMVAETSVHAVEGEDDTPSASASLALGIAYANLGQPEAARRAFAVAHEGNRAIGYHHMVGGGLMQEVLYVVLPYYADHLAERRRLVSEAARAWAQASDMQDDFTANATRLPLLVVEGQWDEARRLTQTIKQGTWTNQLFGVATRGFLAYARGEVALAWSVIKEWMPDGPRTELGDVMYFTTLSLQRVAVMLALDADELSTATEWLAAHDRWLTWSGGVLGQAEGHLLWAQYYRATGDRQRANQHVTHALACATEPRQPLALLAAHRLLGELAIAQRQFEDAMRHLDTALTLAEGCATPFERALTLLARVDLCAATGDRDTAVTLLDEVRTICTPLNAVLALARADILASRLATRGVPAAYPAGLSSREVEVLRLLASGRTNREIAEALFLAIGTVNVHVNHILTKTATVNRTEAAAFALRHGLA